MRSFATILTLFFLMAPGALSQTPGNCTLGSAQNDLDVSNVFARMFNTGSLFFGSTTTNGDGYVVPRSSENSPLYAAGLWVGGRVDGVLRAAGSRYTNFTFWPGPLDEGATLPNPDDCSPFDRIFVVSRLDLDRYESGQGASADLADWPVGLGAPAMDASGQPLAITSREQTLDLAAGERPMLFGSQTAFWVMNDVGGDHSALETPPLGIEVQVIAFSVGGTEPLGAAESTFYRYTVTNRSESAIDDMHVGFFADTDLGGASDDYIGSDEGRNMAFVYNARDSDPVYGTPPSLGFDILTGASSTSTFINGGSPRTTGDPTTGEALYNYLQGLWGDGTPVRENGNGYDQPDTFPVTSYTYPGDPVQQAYWSEVNTDGQGSDSQTGDRRMVVTAPAVTLVSGESHTVDLAILFAQGTDRFDSVTRLRAVSDAVQAAYNANELYAEGPDLTALSAPALLTPEADADLVVADSVTFSWESVDGATGYLLSWGPTEDTALGSIAVTATSLRLNADELLPDPGAIGTVYWSVRAQASGAVGADAPPRSFQAFRNGVPVLPDGTFAYAEIAHPDVSDVCAPEASSTEFCDLGYGNPVHRSLNSTGDYYFSESRGRVVGSDETLPQYGPSEFEIRFTEAGSVAAYLFQSPFNVVRVPFEIWDVGIVPRGETNDPVDDVRLIPYLLADDGGTCAFDPSEIPEGLATFSGFVESDRIYAYYPETTYGDVEAALGPQVDATSDGCFAAGTQEAIFFGAGPIAIQRQVFGSPASAPALPPTGTVVRLYTVNRPGFNTSGEPTPGASGEIALRVGPNPTRGVATVRLRLDAPDVLSVRVLDVLGREVARLADGRHASGEHSFSMPTGLAPGVYAVEARAGEARMSVSVTVVR